MNMTTWRRERAWRSGGRGRQGINLRRIIKRANKEEGNKEGSKIGAAEKQEQGPTIMQAKEEKERKTIRTKERKTEKVVGKEAIKSQITTAKTKEMEREKRARIMEISQME